MTAKIIYLGYCPCALCGKKTPKFNQWVGPDQRRFCSADCFDSALLRDQLMPITDPAEGLWWARKWAERQPA